MEQRSGNPFVDITGEPLEGSGFETEDPIVEEQSTEGKAEQVPEEDQ